MINHKDIDSLQLLFLSGNPPQELDGFYRGKLVKLFPKSPLVALAGIIAKIWLPWYGKEFSESKKRGHNILPGFLTGLIRSRYGDNVIIGSENNRLKVFPFKTRLTQGTKDKTRVLQLDYNLSENPAQVRHVIDELVKVGENEYLGKAYMKEGQDFRLVAYFSLDK